MTWAVGDTAKCIDVSPIRLPLRARICLGGQFLVLGAFYPVRGVCVHYGTELCLDVGAAHGPKLARRFVKVDPDSLEEAAGQRDEVPA